MPFFGRRFFGLPYFGRAYWATGGSPAPTTLEAGIADALKADATLAALVGARVFPLYLPESSTLPAVYYRVVTRPRPQVLDGSSGLARPRVQLGCVSTSYGDCVAMSAALRGIFDGFQGSLGAVQVIAAVQIDSIDFYEDPKIGSDQGRYHRAVDYRFDHHETVATPAASFPGSAADLESALVAAIEGEATITALIGSRLFPVHVPESATLPALTYQVSGREPDHVLDGAAGLAHATWRFTALSRSYSDVIALAELLRLLFQGFAGLMGATTVLGTLAENESDSLQWATDGTDQQKFERAADFTFLVREPVPSF